MAKTRLDLHKLLEETSGIKNIYFQPPANFKLTYPCIVYKMTGLPRVHADDRPYVMQTEYSIIVIDKRPDSDITFKISNLPRIAMTSRYTADNLYHDVFRIIY